MVLATSVKERKEITGIQIGKEEVKLLLFADVILYMDNPKDTHKELLELKHEFSKVAGGKILYRNPLWFYIPTTSYLKDKFF